MIFVIRQDAIGSSQDLYYDSKLDSFVNLQNDCNTSDIWSYTAIDDRNASLCLNDLFDLNYQNIQPQIPQEFKLIFTQLGCKSDVVKWEDVLPRRLYKTYISSMAEDISGRFDKCNKDYYIQTFRSTAEILRALKPARINTPLLLKYASAETNKAVKTTLLTFKPNSSGYANNIVYDRFKSRTGRLVVKSGPSVLLLKKAYKDIITSSYEGGKIVQFDYISFEARIALAVANKNIHKDIYTELNSQLFNNQFTRKVIKETILSTLFGISCEKLALTLNLNKTQTNDIMETIKCYFAFDEVLKPLVDLYKKTGSIKSHYGRTININNYSPGALYNSYIQSTGVDMALQGFKNIVNLAEKMQLPMRPLFIQHDALIVDIAPELIKHLETIKAIGEDVPDINGNFPLSYDIIS